MALREAYHRISNHLQLLASAIGMLARENAEPTVKEALLQVQSRVFAVARLHAELQRPQGGQMIEVSRFLRRVHDDLLSTMISDPVDGPRLIFNIDSAELPAETAITLAVIVIELVTNALKYGVPESGGEIRVRLERNLGDGWRLSVRDNGPGLPPGASVESRNHGLDFVRRMARKLHGRLAIEPVPRGAALAVYFPEPAPEAVPASAVS